jgi:hypothetical protein
MMRAPFAMATRMLAIQEPPTPKLQRLITTAVATPHWVTLANSLDSELKQRSEPKLVADDRTKIEPMLEMLMKAQSVNPAMWVRAEEVSKDEVRCNLVAHFFVARFYDSEHLQIRAHLINQESEDNAHSHGGSFFSYCISGAYTHELWHKGHSVCGPGFYETVRQTSSLHGSEFAESQHQPGEFTLCSNSSHEHQRGDLYFFDAAPVFHKVFDWWMSRVRPLWITVCLARCVCEVSIWKGRRLLRSW